MLCQGFMTAKKHSLNHLLTKFRLVGGFGAWTQLKGAVYGRSELMLSELFLVGSNTARLDDSELLAKVS